MIYILSRLTGILIKYRMNHQKCSIKKEFLKISQNSQGNTCVGVSFLSNDPKDSIGINQLTLVEF